MSVRADVKKSASTGARALTRSARGGEWRPNCPALELRQPATGADHQQLIAVKLEEQIIIGDDGPEIISEAPYDKRLLA